MALTQRERQQRMDERNRLRRMNEVALDRGIYANNEGELRRAQRLFRLSDRIETRLGDLAEELGMRW